MDLRRGVLKRTRRNAYESARAKYEEENEVGTERVDGGCLFNALRRLCQRYYTADSQGTALSHAFAREEKERDQDE